MKLQALFYCLAPFLVTATAVFADGETPLDARMPIHVSMTEKQLGEICDSEKHDMQIACEAYINGAADQVSLIQLGFCTIVQLPPNLPVTEMKEIVVKFIASRPPSYADVPAAGTVAIALGTVYPCPKK